MLKYRNSNNKWNKSYSFWIIFIINLLCCHNIIGNSLKSLQLTKLQLKPYLQKLNEYGFVVFPNFLNSDDINLVFHDISFRKDLGELREAAIEGPKVDSYSSSYDSNIRVVSKVRNADLMWLNHQYPKNVLEYNVLIHFDNFRKELSSILQLDLQEEETECFYASYPIGGYYKKHIDSYSPKPGIKATDSERILSFILYVSDRIWSVTDGGELRLYGKENNNWKNHIDINPISGNLVLFYSQDFEHEVMITNVNRRAVIGWFRIRSLKL